MEEAKLDPELLKDPNLERFGCRPGKWEGAPWDAMPPGCPVQVLGYNGAVTYCRSAAGQLTAIERWTNGEIENLFAPYISYALWAWPGFGSAGKDADGNPTDPVVKRLERDRARNALINEGRRRGLFDPQDSVRGRGGWRDKSERFVWNSGGFLWTVTNGKLEATRPMEYDGHFYEMKPDVLRPWNEPIAPENSPASTILKSLKTWSFENELDALFVLGWMATGLMGGALDWRPVIFTTGGAGVGKSTLQGLIKRVLGRSLLDTTDTTQAGIYQRVRNDCLPVMVDELENKAGSSRATTIIELARLAASGGFMNRGGADHEGVMFQARNSFLMSAINPPPLETQDRSRMPILNLARLDKSRKATDIVVRDEDGRMILRQIMDGWTEFHEAILPRWKLALHEAGLDARAQATYGTLLAAAELLIGTDIMAEMGIDVETAIGGDDMRRAGAMISHLTAAERSEQTDNWQECLEHVMASPIEAWRSGERITIGSVLYDYRRGELHYNDAKHRLAAAGLGLREALKPHDWGSLAIPYKKLPALNKIFADTKWNGGVWSSALKQGPKDVVVRDLDQKFHTLRIAGVPMKCLLVDVKAFDELVGGDGT
ncbi:hypothetical protein NS365_01180 [Aureimonas ureilytica]|uniref:DUF927 domain-containing protein n=1 Tax=Aureimonas ureilytica TaxID=401562 RepID=A0A147DBN0_9HYPH|nr:hypothetical protein NS365_01180 [Aureimonas ureilytica]